MTKEIRVSVRPNSKKNEICGNVVYVKEKAENNKANIAVIKLFKKKGLNVKIVKGLKSKNKVLRTIS